MQHARRRRRHVDELAAADGVEHLRELRTVSTNFLNGCCQSWRGLRDRVVDGGEQQRVVDLLASGGNAVDAISDPISQATTSTDSALANVPPTASATLAGSQVTWLRTTAPIVEEANWPIVADRKTITMASRARSRVAVDHGLGDGRGDEDPEQAPPDESDEAQ